MSGFLSKYAARPAFAAAALPALLAFINQGLRATKQAAVEHELNESVRHARELIRRCVRDHDLVARIGGDEFAVLLEDAHDRDGRRGFRD